MNSIGSQPGDLAARSQAVLDRHARSFSFAANFLSKSVRREVAVLYAFARAADDLCDEEILGSHDHRMQMLGTMSRAVFETMDTRSCDAADQLATSVGALLAARRVDTSVTSYFLDSLREDSVPRHIRSTGELLRFAYGVAGTVGQMIRPVLGAPAHAERYAMALGVAMQLTNIARDVVEDAARGRCYLPADWGANPQMMANPQTGEQKAQAFSMLQKLLALAEDFYAYAENGLFHIEARNRRAIRIALVLYRAIGRKILRDWR